jgi:hypothetical protein
VMKWRQAGCGARNMQVLELIGGQVAMVERKDGSQQSTSIGTLLGPRADCAAVSFQCTTSKSLRTSEVTTSEAYWQRFVDADCGF